MKDVPKIKHRVFQSLIMLIIWPFVLQYSLANYHNTKLWFLITFQELQFEAERHENHYPFVLVFFKLSYAGTYRYWARKEKNHCFWKQDLSVLELWHGFPSAGLCKLPRICSPEQQEQPCEKPRQEAAGANVQGCCCSGSAPAQVRKWSSGWS